MSIFPYVTTKAHITIDAPQMCARTHTHTHTHTETEALACIYQYIRFFMLTPYPEILYTH